MRFLNLIPIILLTVSCGRKTIKKTQYIENPFDNSGNDARLVDLENRVASIELNISNTITTINSLSDSLQTLEDTLNSLHNEFDQSNLDQDAAIQDLIDSTTTNYNNLLAMINSLQGQVTNNVSQLVTLQSQNTIVAYLDPCGDKPNAYDEIILATSQGEFVAYFEQGGQRFLTKLEKNVQYQTTDSQACLFKIDNNGNLI